MDRVGQRRDDRAQGCAASPLAAPRPLRRVSADPVLTKQEVAIALGVSHPLGALAVAGRAPGARSPWSSEGSHTFRTNPDAVYPKRYKSALRVTIASSAAPYGYTLTIWTSGAVLSHAQGIPNAGEALLLLAGAVAAYALVGGLAFGGLSEQLVPEPARAVVWGGLQLVSVALAIGAASLVAHFVEDPAAWLLGGFLVTGVYLVASAAQLTIALATTRGTQSASP